MSQDAQRGLKERDAIEGRRIATARELGGKLRARLAMGHNPFAVREAARSEGLLVRASRRALLLAGHQIDAKLAIHGPLPTTTEMKAALLAWADAADNAKPRFAEERE